MMFPFRFHPNIGAEAPVEAALDYASDYTGPPMIERQPYVGGTIAILAGTLIAATPTPERLYTLYHADPGKLEVELFTGTKAQCEAYVFTPASTMKQVWVKEACTNIAGVASRESRKLWCHLLPGMSFMAAGHTPDAGENGDPDVAPEYSPTTLYRAGAIVQRLGQKYSCRRPFVWGITPTDDGYYWKLVSNVYYLDPTAASNGTGTKASPFNTVEEFRKRLTSGITGFTAAPVGSVFCIRRGASSDIESSLRISMGGSVPGYFLITTYDTGPRPVWTWAPPPNSLTASAGVYSSCIYAMGNGGVSNSDNCLVCNIDFDGKSRAFVRIGTGYPTGGTVSVGDIMTVDNGSQFRVIQEFTLFGRTYHAIEWLDRTNRCETSFYVSGTTTKRIITNAAGATIWYDVTSFTDGPTSGNGSSGFGMANCRVTGMCGGGGGPSSSAAGTTPMSAYAPDGFQVNCLIEHCNQWIDNGAGAGFGGTQRTHAWFNSYLDNGTLNTSHNHQVYGGKWFNNSMLFCRMENTTATKYGNHAFVFHGKAKNVDFAWNYIKGCKSGIGINDGYPSPNEEYMESIYIHHNWMEGATTIGWEVTIVDGLWVHDNVTLDCGNSAFYKNRNTTSLKYPLRNMIRAHNTWMNSYVYDGSFSGTSDMTGVVNIDRFNEIHATDQAQITYFKSVNLPDSEMEADGNLYWRSGGGTVARWNNGGTVQDFASAAAIAAAIVGKEANGRTGNPLFVNTTNNLALQAGSVGEDAAVDVRRRLGSASDILGTTRGAVSSIGAYA